MARSDASITTFDAADLTVDDIVTWVTRPSDGSERISWYLPTHHAGRDVGQDPRRFRHLVEHAAEEVTDAGLLASARALLDDQDFWTHGTAGLAVLVDAERTTVVRLPEPVTELAIVSDRLHLKPIVAAIGRCRDFDVLALSRHAVRLVHVVGSTAVEAEAPGLPTGMPEALRWDDREGQLQSHAAGRTGTGQVAAAFHGQGGSGDARDSDLDRFLHLVERSVGDHRSGSSLPLVLAGVDEIVAKFRRLTGCRHLAPDHVSGNADRLTTAELADLARPFVPNPTADAEQRAREAFLAGATATVDTVEQAVVAAAAGQVASIFVPEDRVIWGRHRPGHHLILEHDERGPGDHDLTDVAATETLRHGGTVFVIPAADIPGGGTAAASLHF